MTDSDNLHMYFVWHGNLGSQSERGMRRQGVDDCGEETKLFINVKSASAKRHWKQNHHQF